MPEKKKPSFLKSLRFRILIILVILGIVPSVIVAHVMVAAYESKAVAVRKQTVEKQCDILCNLLIKENYMNDSSSQDVNSKLELLSNVYDGRILLVDRDYRIIKDTYGVDEGKTLISTMVIKCFKGEEASRYNSKTQKIEMALPVKSPEVKQLQGAMLISFSSNEIAENILELEQKSLLITGIIIVLAVLLGYVLSTVLVKPFARVTKSIEDLTDGYQNEEISVPDYTETALITDAFNKMLSRMKILDESRNEFVSNVSHELKTPIALIQGYAEGLKENISDDPESREFYCDVIADEAKKMNRMVQKLLTLNQIEFGNNQVNMERFDITEMIRNMVESSKILVEKQEVKIIFDEPETHVWADEFMIEEVVNNYLSNARNHVTDGGIIKVSYCRHGNDVRIKVFNTGDHIPQEDIDKLWVKFYKVDKARTREYGGSGIGLSIVEATMKAHGKDYGVANVEGGVEFYFDVESADSESVQC